VRWTFAIVLLRLVVAPSHARNCNALLKPNYVEYDAMTSGFPRMHASGGRTRRRALVITTRRQTSRTATIIA
jgi:hypothetical protein